MARPRMAAGALFFDGAGRVLMVEPSYKDYWDIPGGYVETGESPLQACTREVVEELGISPAIGRLLAMDWAPSAGEGDKVLYLFDGGMLTPELVAGITLQPEELVSHRFFAPAQIEQHTIPRLARRIHAALTARANGTSAYLEHGRITPLPED